MRVPGWLFPFLLFAAIGAGCSVPPALAPETMPAPASLRLDPSPETARTPPPSRATPPAAPDIEALLAPFEDDALMPPLLAGLPFEPGRAYAILAQLPAPAVVDLSAPNRARQGLAGLLNPLAVARAGTVLGHVMIGWRCADGRQGLVSQTGASGGQGQRMLLAGWGVGTLLAEYSDGRLVSLDDLPLPHRRQLEGARARVVAFEFEAQSCQAMRRALAGYITHPAAPTQRYTMVPDPASMQGAGCGSFAAWLAGQGGVFAQIAPALHREVPLADSYFGLGRSVPAGVHPWLPPGAEPEVLQRLPLLSLLRADWEEGAELGSVCLLDMELLLLALDRAQARAGIARPARLRADDEAARQLMAGADRWLARYGRVTPVRMGNARAAVLHWR